VIGGNAFSWRADIAMNLAGCGSAYLRKWKSSRGVIGELEVLDPFRVNPRRVQGQVVFEDGSNGTVVTRTTADIIPIRLGAMRGQLRGMSPITEMRLAVKAGISREVFAQAWLHKRGNPGVVLKMPQAVTPEQAREIREVFEADYASEENAGRTAVVGGGGDIVSLPVSMADAQFVESTQMTWRTMAGAYQVPPNFLGDNAQRRSFEDDLALAKYGIGPIIDAIDHALTADRDVCPPGTGLIVESMPDAILRMSILDRANAYRLLRQGGIETANELRGLENLPPHPDGDVLQQTPVGGAENPNLNGGSGSNGPE
jgi:HK97 family phage portal protein